MQTAIKESLRSFVMLPEGKRFRPLSAVSRAEMASTLLRGGRMPQYLAVNPLFNDVNDLLTRNAVESAQRFPTGRLFFDALNGKPFRPNDERQNLVAAVALVKAANLQSLASSTPLTTIDAQQIPSEWRGYVAVAIQKGLLSTENGSFSPNKSLTRGELAMAMARLNKLAIE
jgi:hypothetical protein